MNENGSVKLRKERTRWGVLSWGRGETKNDFLLSSSLFIFLVKKRNHHLKDSRCSKCEILWESKEKEREIHYGERYKNSRSRDELDKKRIISTVKYMFQRSILHPLISSFSYWKYFWTQKLFDLYWVNELLLKLKDYR